jgi:phospholipid/cholesterol/gamma-HCH transport system ATP-binding protein
MSSDAGVSANHAIPRIFAIDLHKSFDGRPVLRGLTLKVMPGDSVVVLGASGGGKSVLLKHIIGLIKPDKGRVHIDGLEMTHATGNQWRETRRRFGMAFQEGALFDSMNVFDNIAFPLRRHTALSPAEIRARVDECLRTVRLDTSAARKTPNELSGGMRRRVGFARAIATQPEILLFDEPTTGLDPIMAAAITRDVAEMRESMSVTMVTITHDTTVAFRIATHVAMLREGRIAALAPPEEFRELPDPYIRSFLAGDAPAEETTP